MNTPTISIITSTFNAALTLEKCIRSVIDQTNANFEYIVIDGGSTDTTVAIITKFSDFITYWISEPDTGIYDAWNKGLTVAKGKWIMFLGADDVLLPNTISKYLDLIDSTEENLDFISANVELMSDKQEVIKIIGGKWSWEIFKKYMNIAHVGSIHASAYFKKYGKFNTDFKIAGDYELLLRAGKDLKYAHLDAIVAKMGYGGISSKNTKVFKEAFLAKRDSGKINSIICYYDDFIARSKYFLKYLIGYGK